MKVLAIDPGYERLGVAVIEKVRGAKEQLLFSTCIRTSPKDAHAVRLGQIAMQISQIMDNWNPDTLAIETLFFSKNQKTALKVAESRGLVIGLCAARNMRTVELSPNEIKVAVTGDGRSDKTQMIKMIPMLIEIRQEITLDDEFDAIGIGLTCCTLPPQYFT
jgi:crossover junction endodeoxyribonuclease RuvC